MKETKQKANHLIRMVALLALLLVGVNVSWAEVHTLEFMPSQMTAVGSSINSSDGTVTFDSGSEHYLQVLIKEEGIDMLNAAYQAQISWKIEGEGIVTSTDEAKGNVHNVTLSNGTTGQDFYNNMLDRDYTTLTNDAFSTLKYLRVALDDGGQTLKITKITVNIKHKDRVLPSLTGDTKPIMEEGVGMSFTISNTPGYWRQYTDDTYGTVKTDGVIPTNEWNSSYPLTLNTTGHYYFACRDGGNDFCPFAEPHETELVKIDVEVKNTHTVTWDPTVVPENCDAWFTLGDDEVTKYRSTTVVIEGTKVTYHATDDNNDSRRFNRWISGETTSDWGTTYVVNSITTDLANKPEFCTAYYTKAMSTSGGSAKVYATDDGDKTDVSTIKRKSVDSAPDLTFEAGAEEGYDFIGWYKGESKVSELLTFTYTLTDAEKSSDYILTAKFKVHEKVYPFIKAELNDIGKGSVTWENGHLTTDQMWGNHVDIFRFGSISNANVPNNTADDFLGFRYVSEGTAHRILIYYDNDGTEKDLTADDFHTWTTEGADAEVSVGTPGCEYVIGTSTGQPYGDSNVKGHNYADLSNISKLIITATEGTPRIMLNRIGDEGNNYLEYPQRDGISADDYVTKNGDEYTMDIAAIVKKYGYAHLNAIKGANWKNVTVTSIKTKVDPVIIQCPADASKTIHNYTWNDLNIPKNRIKDISRICFAGRSDGPTDVTFSDTYLVKDLTNTLDITSVEYKSGSHGANCIGWDIVAVSDAPAYNGVKMTTTGTQDNHQYIYDFEENGNMEGYNAAMFTGIRFQTTGARFRVIAYTDIDRTDGIGGKKRFIGYVTNSGEGTDAKTQHFKWSDLILQFSDKAMTDEDVSHITKIGVAGDDATADEGIVVFHHVWLDDIADYDNTVVCYGEENAKYDWGITRYVFNQNGIQAQFHIGGGDRTPDGFIRLPNSQTLKIVAPQNSEILKLRVTYRDGEIEDVILSPASDNYTITNTTGNDLYYSKIEVLLSQTSINESRTITSCERSRDYWLYVPIKVLKGAVAGTVPVVYSLHGTTNDYQPTNGGVQNYNDLAEQNGFIVVYPRGELHEFPCFGAGQNRGWQSTGADNDDIQFLRDIKADLLNSTNNPEIYDKINTDKFYITGYSNGGMMAYAAANAASDIFAAYASISGLPMNEFHLQHHGLRAVPFLHIHGTKDDFVNYAHMPTIVDNMVARNGLAYTPTSSILQGSASVYGTATKYNKYVYGTENSGTPFVYYTIGTGITNSDTGMGHNKECVIAGADSKEVIWNFMKNFSLPATMKNNPPTADNDIFKPTISITSGDLNSSSQAVKDANNTARSHGWTVNEGMTICEYGESGGYTQSGQNVYHSLQLNGNTKYYIKFNASNSDATKVVTLRLTKIGNLSAFDNFKAEFTPTSEIVFEKSYKVGNIVAGYELPEDGGEYKLAILTGSLNDKTTISNLVITTATEKETTPAEKPQDTDFTGWFSYVNRLGAQWNFDLCDAPRFIASSLNSEMWHTDYSNTDANRRNGTVTYTYIPAIEGDPIELTYGTIIGEKDYRIPIAAGLKFTGPANSIKIQTELVNGVVTKTHLVLENGVNLYIPYVMNTFTSDNGLKNENPTRDGYHDDFVNCMHHIKRDIVYVALADGSMYDNNRYSNGSDFTRGGEEYVNGKTFQKLNFCAAPGTPCVFNIGRSTVIDRIGVNRNITYSFYTEYINKLGYDAPKVGQRIVGFAEGCKIASDGGSGGYYADCLGITYGGWSSSSYKPFNFDGTMVNDEWSGLQTYNGAGVHPTIQNVPIPTDGFSVMSYTNTKATSESLMPQGSTGAYHPAWEGGFNTSYQANITPWSLPCRGGYVKYEPTIPGVLNVHVIQGAGSVYYIADEFGNLVNEETPNASMFIKTGTGQSYTLVDHKGYQVATDDYVKYSWNVYPGKSYYVFSNTAGIGVTGCYFEPYVCRVYDGVNPLSELDRADVAMVDVRLDHASTYDYNSIVYYPYDTDNPTDPTKTAQNNPHGAPGVKTLTVKSPKTGNSVDGVTEWQNYDINYSAQAVTAKLNRGFDFGKWNSICLPYSMNNLQLEMVFGKGTRVVLLRDVQGPESEQHFDNITANFISHENQDIIAGYPYFIYPTGEGLDGTSISQVQSNASLIENPELVTIDSEGPSVIGQSGYGGMSGYTFKGVLGPTAVEPGSYAMSNVGSLTRITNSGVTLNGYRAYLKFNESPTPLNLNAKALGSISFGRFLDKNEDGEATSIENILFNAGILGAKTDVYSINGQMVRKNTNDLRSLPKGAYIVNGKKYIVK